MSTPIGCRPAGTALLFRISFLDTCRTAGAEDSRGWETPPTRETFLSCKSWFGQSGALAKHQINGMNHGECRTRIRL